MVPLIYQPGVFSEEEDLKELERLRAIHGPEYGKISRAALSLRPWDLSEHDAKVIEEALTTGTAKPKIEVKPLPQY